jgi:hypothetical protein
MTAEKEKFGVNDLHEAVKNSFPAPSYLYMQEVRDATGFDAVRSADGIAVGMYRSCGRQIHGFEMKVSRTDWLKELSQPEKAESLMRYCHRWALVVPDESIVKEGELPSTWGLAVPERSRKNALVRLKWITRAPELQPIPYSMVFITALLYAAKQIDEPARIRALDAARAEGKKKAEDSFDREHRNQDYIQLRAAVDAFEKAAGVSLKYAGEEAGAEMGAQFAEFRRTRGSLTQHLREFRWAAENVQSIAENMAKEVKRLDSRKVEVAV